VPQVQPPTFVPTPIRDQIPGDSGGVNARNGFAYQDHVAAKFCLEMLCRANLLEVWCETYDDIVLVWATQNGAEVIEFTQVKNEALPQLYSIAVLMEQEKKKLGTSLFERSLSRDTCSEEVRFRFVTSRALAAELSPLALDRDDGCRLKQQGNFAAMHEAMSGKAAASYMSPKKNGATYWTERMLWQVHTVEELDASNRLQLIKYLEAAGIPVFADTAAELYERLLWRVKDAAEKRFATAADKKILRKAALAQWLADQASAVPDKGSEAKLRAKLSAAGQSEETVRDAVEMRRSYNRELRKPTYLNLDDNQFVTDKVRGALFQLRTRMDSGEMPAGAPFHQACVDRAIAVKDDCPTLATKPTEGVLLGCMYDIASRCRHRFVRPTS
jgi:hypothetical protein